MIDQRELVERASRGDHLAFDDLARSIIDRLYAIAYRVLRDPELGQDAVQVALWTAWRDLPGLRDPDRFDPWIHKVLVRCCYQEARKIRRASTVSLLSIDGHLVREPGARVAERDAIEAAFRTLSPEQRAIVVLHHQQGIPLVEIAEILEIPAGTARSRLHYATRRLQDALRDDRLGSTSAAAPSPDEERTA